MTAIRGLLVEGFAQNLVKNSKLTGGALPTNYAAMVSGTRAAATSQLGTADGAVAFSMTANSQRPFLETNPIVLTDNTAYVASFWLEQCSITAGNPTIGYISNAGTGAINPDFNEAGNQLPATLPARVSWRFTTGVGATSATMRFGLGCVDVATGTCVVSRPQIEIDQLTSYIPSDANLTGSRSADQVTSPVSSFTFNATQGTVETAFYSPRYFTSEAVIAQLDDNTELNRMSLFIDASGHVRLKVSINGPDTINLDGGLITADAIHEAAFRYGLNDFAIAVDGVMGGTTTVGQVPSISTLRRGHGVSGRSLNAELSTLQVFRSKKDNATLVADTAVTPVTPPAAKPIIWCFSPNSVSASVMAKYNAFSTYIVYEPGIDATHDGTFDNNDSAMNNYYGPIPTSFAGPVAIDWEHWPAAGAGGFLGALVGSTGTTAQQTQAHDETLKVIAAFKSKRPNAAWGMYGLPFGVSFSARFNNTSIITGQETKCRDVYLASKAIMPSCYGFFTQTTGASTAPSGDTINIADLRDKWMASIGEQSTRAIAINRAAGGNAGFYPYISRHYYGRVLYGTSMPASWIYEHAYAICQFVGSNGRKADGCVVWDRGADSAMTEAELKAIYQGVNGLPYDPNMPRPA